MHSASRGGNCALPFFFLWREVVAERPRSRLSIHIRVWTQAEIATGLIKPLFYAATRTQDGAKRALILKEHFDVWGTDGG